MEALFYIADVFTDTPFGGNPLAVFPHAAGIPESKLQQIAREFNFSETSFVFPPDHPKNDCRLRIFTPFREMPTAGHPTIGTASVLLNEGLLVPAHADKAIFEEQVGEITITFSRASGSFTAVAMTQPLPVFGPLHRNAGLLAKILSLQEDDLDERFPVQSVSCGNNFLFVPVKTRTAMEAIKMRTDLLDQHADELDSTEIYAFTTQTVHARSLTHGRMFAPRFGIAEDPATGSGGGPLGCYLVRHGLSDGKNIRCEQGFEMGRPSIIRVDIEKAGDRITGVKVSGETVIVARGSFML